RRITKPDGANWKRRSGKPGPRRNTSRPVRRRKPPPYWRQPGKRRKNYAGKQRKNGKGSWRKRRKSGKRSGKRPMRPVLRRVSAAGEKRRLRYTVRNWPPLSRCAGRRKMRALAFWSWPKWIEERGSVTLVECD